MPIVLEPDEIRARLVRRRKRTMGAMNALHDMLFGYNGTFTQGEFEDTIAELQEKLDDMKRTTGFKPIPFDAQTRKLRKIMDGHGVRPEAKPKRSDSTKSRAPRQPRIRQKKPGALEFGTGIGFDDV